MKRLLVFVAAAVGVSMVLSAGPLYAHHAFASEYDAQKKVALKGTILKMQWINPHSWLHISVAEPDGKVAEWAVEFGNPNQLLHRGWRKDDLPAGAVVTVEGYLAKNGSKTVNARAVVLANGKELFTGSSSPDGPTN